MELPLVVGVDGSASSLLALDWAADEADLLGLPLHLVHASLWELYEAMDPSFGAARPAEQLLASAVERAEQRSPDLKVTTEIVTHDAAIALLRAGREAFALVTGSRRGGGLSGRLPGSVSLAVAARAECPVVVVRGAPQAHGPRRIALGIGDAGEGQAAVRFAFDAAEAHGCALDAVRAWRCPVRENAGNLLGRTDAAQQHEVRAGELLDAALAGSAAERPDVAVHRLTVEAPARQALLESAAAAQLLVIGAHHSRGPAGLRLGSLGHALLHHAPCPVAIIPPDRP